MEKAFAELTIEVKAVETPTQKTQTALEKRIVELIVGMLTGSYIEKGADAASVLFDELNRDFDNRGEEDVSKEYVFMYMMYQQMTFLLARFAADPAYAAVLPWFLEWVVAMPRRSGGDALAAAEGVLSKMIKSGVDCDQVVAFMLRACCLMGFVAKHAQ